MKLLNTTNTNSKVATIGFFDGLHLGHLKIINTLLSYDLEKVVFTFDDSFLKKFKNQEVITPYNQKIDLLNNFDIDYYYPLSDDLLKLSALEFIKYLESINVKVLICGTDFRFGNDFKDYNFIKNNSNIEVVIVDDYYVNDTKLSSTYIRNMIKEDNLAVANTYLYHNVMIEGIVIYDNSNYILSNLSINHSILLKKEYMAFYNGKFFNIKKENNQIILDDNFKDLLTKSIKIYIVG